MDVKIFRPAKSTMQSGRSGREIWVLETLDQGNQNIEPLMGWTESDNTQKQVHLEFENSDDAVTYAKNNGWNYNIMPDNKRRVKPRNYGDNFKYIPPQEQA